MKRNVPLAAIVTLLAVLHIVHLSYGNMKTTRVSFPSSASSGKLSMHGTLFEPESGTKSKRVAIFMHGSGASNRYEKVDLTLWNTDAKPNPLTPNCGVNTLSMAFFEQLAQIFVDNGISVLSYDKRGCCDESLYPSYCSQCSIVLGRFTDTCFYACSEGDEPQQLDVNKLTVFDEATDVASAITFAKNDLHFDELIMVGHSQGVNLSPLALNIYYNMSHASGQVMNLTHVVLLAGGLTEYDYLLIDQFHRVYNRSVELESACIKDPDAPYSQKIIDSMKGIQQDMDVLISASVSFFPKFKRGEYPLDHVYRLGTAYGGYYLMSCIQTSGVEFMSKQLSSPYIEKVKIFTVNSPTDPNLQERDYLPLVNLLKQRTSGPSQINIIPYLTHFLTNADLRYPRPSISKDFSDQLTKFLNN